MRRIMIPVLKSNEIKDAFDEYITNHQDPIPVAIENSIEDGMKCKATIDATIGNTSVIDSKYIIVDLFDFEDKELASIVNKAIGMINEGEIKAACNCVGELDETHTHVKEINNIAYLHLCNNSGESVIRANLKPHTKKRGGRKHERH